MAYFESSKLKDSNGNIINPAEEDTSIASSNLLQRILSVLMSPVGFDRSSGRQRSTAVIESGTVSTVSTVTTVTGLTNIDGRNGAMLINSASISAWSTSNRNLIS